MATNEDTTGTTVRQVERMNCGQIESREVRGPTRTDAGSSLIEHHLHGKQAPYRSNIPVLDVQTVRLVHQKALATRTTQDRVITEITKS